MDAATIRYLSAQEVRRLLKHAKANSKRDHALLLLSYRHGLRASEVGILRKDDVNFGANRITIRRLKRSLGGDHPLAPDEGQALRSYLRSRQDSLPYLFVSRNMRPISRYALDDLMKRYGALAKLPPDRRHFHCLKHSIAAHLIAAGGDVIVVRDWLGHRNIQNTMVYAQLLSPRRDAEVTRLLQSQEIA